MVTLVCTFVNLLECMGVSGKLDFNTEENAVLHGTKQEQCCRVVEVAMEISFASALFGVAALLSSLAALIWSLRRKP